MTVYIDAITAGSIQLIYLQYQVWLRKRQEAEERGNRSGAIQSR